MTGCANLICSCDEEFICLHRSTLQALPRRPCPRNVRGYLIPRMLAQSPSAAASGVHRDVIDCGKGVLPDACSSA